MFKTAAPALCLALALSLAVQAHAEVKRLGTPSCSFTCDVPASWTYQRTDAGVRMEAPDGRSMVAIEAFLNAGRTAEGICKGHMASLQAKGVPFALVKQGEESCELSVADPGFGLSRRVIAAGGKAYSVVTCAGDRKACARAAASVRLPE